MNNVWISTTKVCEQLGISRETLRKLCQRKVFQPGRDFRRVACSAMKGPMQWHSENIEAAITAWNEENLTF